MNFASNAPPFQRHQSLEGNDTQRMDSDSSTLDESPAMQTTALSAVPDSPPHHSQVEIEEIDDDKADQSHKMDTDKKNALHKPLTNTTSLANVSREHIATLALSPALSTTSPAATSLPSSSSILPTRAPSISNDPVDHLSDNDVRYFPALSRSGRYTLLRTLQHSLFGAVKVARDLQTLKKVAIKISSRKHATQGRARSGSRVLENVKREVHVMQYIKGVIADYLHAADQRTAEGGSHVPLLVPALPNSSTSADDSSSSSSSASASSASTVSDLIPASGNAASNALVSRVVRGDELMDVDVSRRSLAVSGSASSVSELFRGPSSDPLPAGATNVCLFLDELEDDYFHYLITEYVEGPDLHSLLVSIPDHRLREDQAKFLFRQMVDAVFFLHAHNVAHLDLSLENVCVDTNTGTIKLIDFGVAAIHPRANEKKAIPLADSMQNRLVPSQSRPLLPASAASSSSAAPIPTTSRLLLPSPSPTADAPLMSFFCAAIPDRHRQPGKAGYQSPELHNGMAFDAFAADVFSLGVILYALCTSRPPFTAPHPSDNWFKLIASGQWVQLINHARKNAHLYYNSEEELNDASPEFLSNRQRGLEYMKMYDGLSQDLLHLLDSMLKPEKQRIHLEQLYQHPWMRDDTTQTRFQQQRLQTVRPRFVISS